MPKLIVPAAAALLLGAVVTEIYSRLLAGQYFGLYVLAATAVFVGAYISTWLALRQVVVQDTQKPARRRDGGGSRPARKGAGGADAGRRRKSAQADRGPAPGNGRESGQVKWFNRNKGFGFIIRDAGGEIFVHQRSLADPGRRSLRDGQRVTFTVVEHEKGLQAESVSVDDDQVGADPVDGAAAD
jgi:cold shock CspA family protein